MSHELRKLFCNEKRGKAIQAQRTAGNRKGVINELSLMELNNYLQNTLLQDTDRMSMAHSLEIRVPFLDHRLVEKLFQIPGHMKISGPYPKKLLISAMKDLLPDDIYKRPKKGFVFPFEQWLKGPLRKYCDDILYEKRIDKIPFINKSAVREIWCEYKNGSRLYNYSSILCLLSFFNWYDRTIR